jgi:putative FmdB family regulatory protein
MPLREFTCKDCDHGWEELIRSTADEPEKCPHCDSQNIYQTLSSYGGYQGSFGSSSTRPRFSGSFKRVKN